MKSISFPLRLNLENDNVGTLQEALDDLGYDIDTKERSQMKFGTSTRKAVREFQKKEGLEVTGDVENKTAHRLNQKLSNRISEAGEKYRVRGSVRDENWEGMSNVRVQLLQKTFDGEHLLIERTTFKNGFYDAIYRTTDLVQARPKGEANKGDETLSVRLEVRVVDDNGENLFPPKRIMGPHKVEWLNFTAGKQPYMGESTYVTQMKAVKPVLSGRLLANLVETEEKNQLTVLATESGLKVDQVMRLVLAHRLTAETEIAPEVFYALLAQRLPAGLPEHLLSATQNFERIDALVENTIDGIALMSSRLRERAVEQAIKTNLIPRDAQQKLDKWTEELAALTRTSTLDQPMGRGTTTMRDILDETKLNSDKYEPVAALYLDYGGFGTAFWKEVKENDVFESDSLQDLQRTLQLGFVARNHLPMVRVLKDRMETDAPFNEPRELAWMDLEGWKEEVQSAGEEAVPEAIDAENTEQRMELFARELQQRTELSFPTEALTARVGRSDNGVVRHKEELTRFVRENPDFDLTKEHVEGYLHNRNGWENNFEKPDQALEDMKRLQRTLQIEPVPRIAGSLLESGIHSASQIYHMGKEHFIGNYSGTENLTETEAERVFKRARHTYARTIKRIVEFDPRFNRDAPRAVGKNHLDDSEEVEEQLPTLESLFGSLDFCNCSHCQSILSPAAYYVDLLRFLAQSNGSSDSKSPVEVLLERRPDLERIKLDCKNTNTALPYIDLTCEILERAVAPPEEGDEVYYQTNWSSDELRAQPEHIRSEAYKVLRNARAPLSMPFDLWTLQARTYLDHLGVSRRELMRAFRPREGWKPQSSPPEFQIGLPYLEAESFGISAAELEIIVKKKASTAAQKKFWESDDPTTELLNMEAFLDTARLSYDEGVRLLQSRFVNPVNDSGNRIVIERPVKDCAVSAQQLNRLNVGLLDRVNRFLRIWRKTDWSMYELDLLLRHQSVGKGKLNSDTIRQLWNIKKLQEALDLGVEETLALFGDLNTDALPSIVESGPIVPDPVYQRLFLNQTVQDPIADAFEVANITSSGGSESIKDHRSAISAAFGLSEEEVKHLSAKTDGSLTLSNLSKIFRYGVTAQGLGIPVDRLLLLIDLAEINAPFASPEDVRELISIYKLVDQSPLTLNQLAANLQWRPDSPDASSEAILAGEVQQLHSSLEQIRNDLLQSSEPLQDILSRTLSSIGTFSESSVLDTTHRIIDGTWDQPSGDPHLTDSERKTFIRDHFDLFLDPAKAIQELATLSASSASDREQKIRDRYLWVLQQLHAHLSEDIVIERVANWLNLSTSTTVLLLRNLSLNGQNGTLLDILTSTSFVEAIPNEDAEFPFSAGDLPNVFEALRLLKKTGKLIRNRSLNSKDVDWLLTHGPALGFSDFNTLPVKSGQSAASFQNWQQFEELLRLKDSISEKGDTSFFKVLDHVRHGNSVSDLLDEMADLTGWDRDTLQSIHDGLNLRISKEYKKPATYRRIHTCIEQVDRIGATADSLFSWSRPVVTEQTAQQIKQAVKSKYDKERWLSIASPLQDTIRDKKRAALVDYLISHPAPADPSDPNSDPAWQDVEDLYAYFLIDVEMTSCQLTSRIKQAISSVHLFVQRCRMNLEPDVDPLHKTNWDKWEWMKNYRVWEANRKVFLYPENWIEPELRQKKSPFFESLEDQLQQNELTDENAEKAFRGYLDRLEDVDRLEVVGTCVQEKGDTSTQHVFARTLGEPPIYYHRQYVDGTSWSPWEKVDLDIETEHLVPVLYQDRLYLFWLTFRERPKKEQKTAPAEASGSSSRPAGSRQYLEIQLAWSVFRNRKWTPKRVSSNRLIHPWPRPRSTYHLKPRWNKASSRLYLDIFISTSETFNNNAEEYVGVTDNSNGWVKFTTNEHDPSKRPWHSSTFVFNGDVIDVRLKELHTNNKRNGSLQEARKEYGEEGSIEPLQSVQPNIRLPAHQYFRNTHLVNIPGHESLTVYTRRRGKMTDVELLDDPETPYSVVINLRDVQPDFIDRSFFYQDTERSYFVEPQKLYRRENYLTPDRTYQYHAYRVRYRFRPFYHPYVETFKRALNRAGIDELLKRKMQIKPYSVGVGSNFNFDNTYDPSVIAAPTDNREIVDFSSGGPYALYNWEIFFHAPLKIADRLRQNQRFEEALKWFHYIFDPTNVSDDPTPQRYWKTKPFYEANSSDYREQRIRNLLRQVTEGEEEEISQVEQWRKHPFRPHLIARLRPVAYQRTVVMKYIDTLIEWGDMLFRRDSIESINRATQLYILAAEILGPRPEEVPSPERAEDKTYAELKDDLDAFGNAMTDVVNEFEQTVDVPIEYGSGSASDDGEQGPPLPRLETFYFCIPHNSKMLEYWDRVEDRLYKIRHCQNIEGKTRMLSLFEPPIEPGRLVEAAAAGGLASAASGGTQAAIPPYRFNIMIQKANSFCSEVQSLGKALLSALEKRDSEELSRIRASHKQNIQHAMREMRELQIEKSEKQIEALEKTREKVTERRDYFAGKKYMLRQEKQANALSVSSAAIETSVAAGYVLAGGLQFIPEFVLGAAGFGGSPTTTGETGGNKAAGAAEKGVKTLNAAARALDKNAAVLKTQASYKRRQNDWKHQKKMAEKELEHIDTQIETAEIRLESAERELELQEQRIENAEEVYEFLQDKYTGKELYDWMVSQLSSLYFQSYQLAYEMAKRAEQCYRYELGIDDASYVQFGHWNNLKKGLLAGERLSQDLSAMESAYYERNERELELKKDISIAQVAPMSLLKLKKTGSCKIELPEVLFDMDYPGHYFRRIKSVSITIPSVAGPYTGVHGTLTLLKNSCRIDNVVGSQYKRTGPGDDRFRDEFAAVQSIATSTGQNDSGLFQLNFNDQRYLPFEGGGAVSTWQLELPKETNAFDFDSISDIILHVNYTARDGGGMLREKALQNVQQSIPKEGVQLLSPRREMSDAWHRFLHPSGEASEQVLSLELGPQHFPYYARSGIVKVKSIEVVASFTNSDSYDLVITPPGDSDQTGTLKPDPTLDGTHRAEINASNGSPWSLGQWQLKIRSESASNFQSLSPDKLEELHLIINYELQ